MRRNTIQRLQKRSRTKKRFAMIVKDYNGLPVNLETAIDFQISLFPDKLWHVYIIAKDNSIHKIEGPFKNKYEAVKWLYENLFMQEF